MKIKVYEIWGAIFSIIAGSLLHFVYEWSGGSKIVALFGGVNESTWEHLKLAFWPTLFFAVFEWFMIKNRPKNFCFATMIKLFSMPLIIIILFYGWLLFFKDNFIWDISIFVVAVILGYYFSYLIMKSEKVIGWEKISMVLITIGILKFSFFTYFPPHVFLMHDPVKGGYGIEK